MGLSFETLRAGNMARADHFRNANGEHVEREEWSVSDWIGAVVGELGEFANLHKKVRRGDLTIEEARGELADELADVLTYLDLLAASLDIDLGNATRAKWNAVSERVGSPVYLGADDEWHVFPANHGESFVINGSTWTYDAERRAYDVRPPATPTNARESEQS